MSETTPRVTMVMPVFNHAGFVAEAVRSCLAQDYANLQIVISDDSSEDESFSIIEREVLDYSGPHTVLLNRNPQNLFLDHIPAIMDRFEGGLVIVACPDDVHYPERASTLAALWRETGASVLCSAARMIDGAGRPIGHHRLHDGAPDLSLDHFLRHGDNATCFGAGMAWDRRVVDTFGFLNRGARNIDFNIPFRGLLLDGAAFHNAPLLDWRQHEQNMTLRVGAAATDGDIDALLTAERFHLNRMINWHGVIEDALKATQFGLDRATANQIGNIAGNHILQFIAGWRPIRHELTRKRVDRF